MKIAVLLPDQEEWSDDAQALEADLAEDGYEPLLAYAEGDASRQVSQIQEMLEQQVAAFIIHSGRRLWTDGCAGRSKRGRDPGIFL